MGFILTSICVFMVFFSRAAGSVPRPLLTPDPAPSAEPERPEAPYLQLPVFLHSRKPRVDKRHFSPAHGNSRDPLPERVRDVLLPAPQRRPNTRVRPSGPVRVACSAGEMRVRIHTPHVQVRLGTCDVNKTSAQSVLFRYGLHECGTRRRIINEAVVYSNTLFYLPDTSLSASEIISIPVHCHFNRFHYSYKIGFLPPDERLKIFKPMKTKGGVTLTACDAQWNRLSPSESFRIGQPMYFEAETLYVPDRERLYVHSCHVTSNISCVSSPRINIIGNYGCLIDSKSRSNSRFINSTRRNVVRFTIDAFTLHGEVQKYLFIHCEMSIRSIIPTETSKSCTYNQLEERWEELYGVDSVCSCCNSSCIPEVPTMIRSLTSELGALVEQHTEGPSRKNPTPSSEGTFTPNPEHPTLTPEKPPRTNIPERTLTPVHTHRAVTPRRTTTTTTTNTTTAAVHARTAPPEPYRVFEDVFGLS